jgi:hypothetical protein
MYNMVKISKRKTRDLNKVKCIKDKSNQLLVKVEEIRTYGEITLMGYSVMGMGVQCPS